ncbi:MAG: hypothetical protein ACFE9N_07110 [Promethearchaeota archaeon]
MKIKHKKKEDSRPINMVLLAISFIIVSVLGIVFITQMELHPGWAWEEIRDIYPIEMSGFETEDLNGNGVNEVIVYSDMHGTDQLDRYESFQYGGIFCLEGANGKLLWSREYDGPVKNLFPIMDVDGDGINDYFVSKAAVNSTWRIVDDRIEPQIIRNQYTNQLIKGSNGTDISIMTGDGLNFTNFRTIDLISFNDLTDSQEDLVLLEAEAYEVGGHTEYNCSINTYFINGTMTRNITGVYKSWIDERYSMPALELFPYFDQSQLLYIDRDSLFLYNLSEDDYLREIYNISFTINNYEIIEDLNTDGIPEIITANWEGNITIYDGALGGKLYQFQLDPDLDEISFNEIHTESTTDGLTYVLLNYRYRNHNTSFERKFMQVYRLELGSHVLEWEVIREGYDRVDAEVYVLEEDLNEDSVDEIIFLERFRPFIGFSEVNRYKIINFLNNHVFAIINTEYSGDTLFTISDFDNDGKKDFIVAGSDRIAALSARKPWGIWLSPAFPLGLPLFIVLVILLVAGVIIIILRGRRLQYQRKSIKEHKLTVAVNVLAISLMSLTFILFLTLMNVFNNTLITGSNNSNIVMTFIIVTIIWYGALPLTAALFNRFAPQFAYVFVKLRDLFFKISKGYNHDILVVDMGERKEVGLIIQLKRLVLPLLLSIAVGFYSYDALTTLFNFPKTFDVFGSTEFFGFMMGYMLCCILPMILSFLLFAFFISGNYLLDDAGVVYYRENRKYRQPGDIEPISIWAQSIVKGIAGLSALITFGAFIASVDFSGFFGEGGGALNLIFGLLIVIVMFVGIPFLTSFSYVLLAGEIMELDAEKNIQKLYNIMEKNGYDTKPRDITNLYSSGYESSKREPPKEIEEKDNKTD